MPVNVNYSPVGLLGTLATEAGLGQAREKAQQFALQRSQQVVTEGYLILARQQAEREEAARQRAFQLQEAAAERSARRDTPMAQHVLTASEQARMDRVERQTATRKQLDAMLNAGQITPENYQRAWFGILSGNDTLAAHALAQEKPSISDPEEVRIVQARHTAARRQLEKQLAIALKGQEDFGFDERMNAQYTTRIDAINKKIEEANTAEEAELSRLRQSRKSGMEVRPEGTIQIVQHGQSSGIGTLPPGEILDSGIGTLPPGEILDSGLPDMGDIPTGRPLTAAIVSYAKRQFGSDAEAAKKWLREQGYQVD